MKGGGPSWGLRLFLFTVIRPWALANYDESSPESVDAHPSRRPFVSRLTRGCSPSAVTEDGSLFDLSPKTHARIVTGIGSDVARPFALRDATDSRQVTSPRQTEDGRKPCKRRFVVGACARASAGSRHGVCGGVFSLALSSAHLLWPCMQTPLSLFHFQKKLSLKMRMQS